ncbi:MAG: hypothetical protein U0931_03215 [Vulcanimicrobiota bacterium]
MSIFPLPLTALEQMFWLDRRRPLDIWLEASFRQKLDHQRVQQSLVCLASRHPLLLARPQRRAQQWLWEPAAEAIPLVLVGQQQAWSPLPLDPELIRVYLVEKASGCSLYFHIHHAVCDGTGSRQLLSDFGLAYANPSNALTPLDPARLARRGRIPAAPPQAPASWHKSLRDVLGFLFPWPQVLAGAGEQARLRPFSKRIIEAGPVLERARAAGAGLTELASSDLFACLARWQRQHGVQRGRLRLLIPMDLRELDDRRLPACNRITFAFLQRSLHQCGPDLSRELSSEREYIKTYRTDLDFLRGLQLVAGSRLLPWLLRAPLPMCSAILTNMGEVSPLRGFDWEEGGLRVGDVLCDHVSGATALRPGTRAAFSLCRFGGRLAVGLRSSLAEQAEGELLDSFTHRLVHG